MGIDFRPQTGQLYGLGLNGATGQLYAINPTTAVATPAGAAFSTTLSGSSFGFDFDPVSDTVRVTSNLKENLRVNPNTGALAALDTNVSVGTLTGLAYDRNFQGATQTTLYGYNFTADKLVTVGSVNGTPNSPNGGAVGDVGPSGVIVQAGTSANLGFDIGADGVAYLNLVASKNGTLTSGFYTADLSTGLVSLLGSFGGMTLTDLSVAPAVKFAVAGFPSPIGANQGGGFTVTAQDAFGTKVPGYQGTVVFTSSDPQASLPANAPLAGGVGSFNATFKTPGSQSLTAADTLNSSLTGTQIVTVNAVGGGGGGSKPFNFDKLGAYRASDGSWSLDSDGTFGFAPTDQVFLHFSPPGAQGVAGDWTGTGRANIGDFSSGTWHLDLNGNGVLDAGETFNFGTAGDKPVVGDWTGDGKAKLGVFRANADGSGLFVLDTNNNRQADGGDLSFTFGLATDRIVVGDWTGDRVSKVGVFRDATAFGAPGAAVFTLDINNNHAFDAGTDQVFVFGLITDGLVVGDWNGNGVSKVGVYRDGSAGYNAPGTALFTLDTNGNRGFDAGVDAVFLFGLTSDQFVGADWQVTPPVLPALHAAGGQGPGGAAPLTQAELAPVLRQAVAYWAQHGAGADRLASARAQIRDLDGDLLGLAGDGEILLDTDAAGWGWSADAAPGRMDLLTVVTHELGHELGLPDLDEAGHPGDVMDATLPVGIRRVD